MVFAGARSSWNVKRNQRGKRDERRVLPLYPAFRDAHRLLFRVRLMDARKARAVYGDSFFDGNNVLFNAFFLRESREGRFPP